MEKFRKLGITEELLSSIKEHAFEAPTEIQEKAIPAVLSRKDIIAGAATGSGKTLVFGTGILQNCEKIGEIQALVLVPTRELADQVARTLRKFASNKFLNIVDVYGGVSMGPQVQKLKRADVVVGTPGRILDHLEHGTLELGFVKILVLDEADRMFDMGFIKDVRRIIGRCPEKRQTMLFSATIPRELKKLSEDYMNEPVEIAAESQVDPSKLTQIFYDVPDNMKFSLLVHLLKNDKSGLVMVFCNTQRNTDFVAGNLQQAGINALAIHGGYSQDRRTKTIEQFHAKKVDVLVCTDVAARGLDIKEVSHIYNYDLPAESKQYIHRIGRTARAGSEGKAVVILASRDYDNFRRLTRETRFAIKREELPEFEKVFVQFSIGRRFGGGRFGGGRFGSSRFGENRERRARGSGDGGSRSFERRFSGNREAHGHSPYGKGRFGGRHKRRERRRSRFHRRY